MIENKFLTILMTHEIFKNDYKIFFYYPSYFEVIFNAYIPNMETLYSSLETFNYAEEENL